MIIMDKYFDYIFSSIVEDVKMLPNIFFGYQYGMGILIAFLYVAWIGIKNILLLLPIFITINTFFNAMSSVIKIRINKN
jgi:hypothetical protein